MGRRITKRTAVSSAMLRGSAGAAPMAGRKGVAAILAMMFLIVFGSLTAAMAIASRGNIATAATNLHVLRAQAAAETGMSIAAARLLDAADRMWVANSDISPDYMWKLWSPDGVNNGGFNSATDRVQTGVYGPVISGSPNAQDMNIAQTLASSYNLMDPASRLETSDYHAATTLATLRSRSEFSSADTGRYRATNWVQTPVIRLESRTGGNPARFMGTAYSVLYIPLAPRAATGNEPAQEGNEVRVVVTGYDFSRINRERNAANAVVMEPIKRTIVQDFKLVKRVDQAIVSPSRIMLGKNVQIEGNLGVLYGQQVNGQIRNPADNSPFKFADPLVMRSDFYGLDLDLDRRLNAFYTALQGFNTTGSGSMEPGVPAGNLENRLRVDSTTNANSIALAESNYQNAGGTESGGFSDVTGDGYIDEFDIFIKKYDTTGPAGTPDGRVSPAEFTRDPLLFDLIDSSNPDRNRDNIWGFVDLNNNGIRETNEPFLDQLNGFSADNNLGYLDGYIDRRDRYVKVSGRMMYRVSQSDWNSALAQRTNEGLPSQNDLRNTYNRVQGAIRPREGEAAQTFGLTENQVPDVQTDSIVSSNNELLNGTYSTVNNFFATLQTPANFTVPVGGVTASMNQGSLLDDLDPSDGAQWDGVPNGSATPDPMASSGAYYERMPYDSRSFYDWYYRPVYRNMVFKNATIPMGLNPLFINCWFIGVTRIEAYEANHAPDSGNTNGSILGSAARLWNEYGKMTRTGNNAPVLVNPRTRYETVCAGYTWATEFPELSTLSSTSIPTSGPDVMLANPPLDRGDVPVSMRLNGGGPGTCGQPVQGWEGLVNPLVVPNSGNPVYAVGITGIDNTGRPNRVDVRGKRIVSTKWLSNNVRFHDCTFVGSVVSAVPKQYSSARNKIQYTGATRIVNTPDRIPFDSSLRPYIDDAWGTNLDPDYLKSIQKSTMMLPNFSVDIGSFVTASPTLANGIVELRGATIAGVLDVRGNASIEGSLLLTFNPKLGEAPMQSMSGDPVGNPALFNATLGYFGDGQGDQEGVDPSQMPTVGGLLVAGWDTNGDGLIDVTPTGPNDPGPGAGATPVYFNYGRINVKFNPRIGLPNGLRLPLRFDPITTTYREERLAQ